MLAQSGSSSEECRIHEGAAAERRLAEMVLRPSYLHEAILRGHEKQARCLPIHPKSYRGQVMWAETLGELRTQTLDTNRGWDIGRSKNYETAYNAEIGIAIAVVAGDVNTGVRGFNPPKAARKRGPVTTKRVGRNTLGQIPFDLPEFTTAPKDDELCATWFFLLRARDEVMYSELSLPVSMGGDNKISRWAERVLLPELPLVGAITPEEPAEETEETPVIDVRRK